MKDKTFLMIPGPTPVPERVLLDMAKHPIGHRSSEFSVILEEVYENLKYVLNEPKTTLENFVIKSINKVEGIFVGISSGAALLAAIEYIQKHNLINKKVVIIYNSMI